MNKILLAIALVAISLLSYGQDIHFSQFNASPLTLNPALTGKLPCTYRAALNYRNQWNSVPAPYVTYSGAFDAGIWKNRLGGDAVGVGFLVYNDVAGDGDLSNLNLSLSLAYHKALGDNHILSAGFQASYVQRSVNLFKLVFPNQIGPNGVDQTLNSNEPKLEDINYVDLNAGLHWSSVISDNFSFNLGGAYYHILEPVESFYDDKDNTLAPRYVGHGGFSVGLSEKFSLSPSFLYMQQNNNREINGGAALGYHLDEAVLYFGSWYRFEDAVVALVGLEFQNLMFGFSYDVNISDVSEISNYKGGFELSLTYNGCIATERKVFHCPKF